MEPAPFQRPQAIQQEIETSLCKPIGLPRLSELAKPGMKIALVIDDDSRPTPVAQLLPAVLAEIQQGGASLDQVTIVPATGVHFPMSAAAIAQRVGNISRFTRGSARL